MVNGVVGKVLVSAGSVVRPDVARGAREAVAVASDPCVGSYIANGGYSWAQTAPALASISPPDSGLYRRNASGRQSGIRQMLCLLECSIVCGSSGNLPLMKILVVDDHALIREALHGVLRKLTRDAV